MRAEPDASSPLSSRKVRYVHSDSAVLAGSPRPRAAHHSVTVPHRNPTRPSVVQRVNGRPSVSDSRRLAARIAVIASRLSGRPLASA